MSTESHESTSGAHVSSRHDAPEKRLSIIVPCYRVAEYLPACLDSLLAQTLTNIEIICINDGSPDECIHILRAYEWRHPDTVIVIDKENEGVWRARFDGIRVARGEYIGFVDSDDTVEPDFAESLYRAARDGDADIAVCGFTREDLSSGAVLSREMCAPRPAFTPADDAGRFVELNGAPWNKIFRARLLKGMGDLREPPPVLDDLLFHLLAYLRVEGEVVFVPRPFVHYMVRGDSTINSVRPGQVEAVFAAFREVKAAYATASAPPPLMDVLTADAFLHVGVSLAFRLSCDRNCDLRAVLERHTEFLDAEFAGWRHSPYINVRYAATRRGAFVKLLVVQRIYRLHLMPAFLRVYRFMIERMGVDIKW